MEATETTAASALASSSRPERTPEHFDFYIKIQLLKLALSENSRMPLQRATERLSDILGAMPCLDDYSDVVITDNFSPAGETPYINDEVRTHSSCPYVCFAIKPDFRQFRDVAGFVCSIIAPLKSFVPQEPVIEYIFPSKDDPTAWKAKNENKVIDTSLDTPLILDRLDDFLRVYKWAAHMSKTVPTLLQIDEAVRYISFVLWRLAPYSRRYEHKRHKDMYRMMHYYDVLEYKCEGTDITTVRDYDPAEMSIGFMEPVAEAMMQTAIDLDVLYRRTPPFLRWFVTHHHNNKLSLRSLLTDSDREKFRDINRFSASRVLRPVKIYFRLLNIRYPSELHMDIYLGYVDVSIGDSEILCISYQYYFYEENSTDYLIRRLREEIGELTGTDVDDDTIGRLTDLVNSNRIRITDR